jgi:pimeloyl-ACP methyl ester carboxylesterase
MKKMLFSMAISCIACLPIYAQKTPDLNLPDDLQLLDKKVTESEMAIPGIKKGCEAKIVWADPAKRSKTKVVFLYIHGFGSSQADGDPIHRDIAKKYKANLYLARLAGHGVDLGDSTMANVTADDFATSAEYALAVAGRLGDEVIVISSSFGGALSCWLASRHPEIRALVLYSPCIRVNDPRAEIFAQPGGLEQAIKYAGSPIVEFKPMSKEFAQYWTTRYHMNGLAAFQTFLFGKINKETFEKIKCPVFMGYWYKDETVKDTVASVPAMLSMFDELGSVKKQKVAFPNVGNHAIATPVLSKDIFSVRRETERFLDGIM